MTIDTAVPGSRRDRLARGLMRPWPAGEQARTLLDRYAFASPTAQLEYRLRLKICPFEEVAARVPERGRVLDLGCGYGLLSNLLALDAPSRRVTGIDRAADRIRTAQRSALGRTNLEFACGDVTEVPFGSADCVAMNDLLHHIPHRLQIPLLTKCFECLPEGGLLLIKDVDKSTLWKYVWNYTHDLLKNRWLPFYCLDGPILEAILGLIGFGVTTVRLDTGYPYSHVLYVCTKRAAA